MATRRRTAPDRHCGSAREAHARLRRHGDVPCPLSTATRRLGMVDYDTRGQETRADVASLARRGKDSVGPSKTPNGTFPGPRSPL